MPTHDPDRGAVDEEGASLRFVCVWGVCVCVCVCVRAHV